MTTTRRIITVGDVVRYRGHVDTVKAIYAGTMKGEFECASGTFRQARAILVLERDSGHYPVGDDIELLLPEGTDEEGRYPRGGYGVYTDVSRQPRSKPLEMEYVCRMCNPYAPDGPTELRECSSRGGVTPHVLVPKDVDEEGQCPQGGYGICMDAAGTKQAKYVCEKCEPSDVPLSKSRMLWCDKCGREVWHLPRKEEYEPEPPEGMEYVCQMCDSTLAWKEPVVMRRCPLGKGDLTPHVLVDCTGVS